MHWNLAAESRKGRTHLNSEKPDLKKARRRKDIDLSKIDRLPPHSLEAEQGLLGCCLMDGQNSCDKIGERAFGTEMLYDLRHQEILIAVLDLADERIPVDFITLSQKLKDKGMLESCGGVAYLTTLADSCPSSANLPFYIDIVEEKFKLRRTIQVCSNIIGSIYAEENDGGVDELLDEAERSLAKCNSSEVNLGFMDGKEAAGLALSAIERAHESKGKLLGIATGFADYDKITSGLHNSEMTVIAARPSCGKTSLAMNIAEHVAFDEKLAVGVFTLEMSAESLAQRMICSRARVNIRDVREGFLHDRDFPKLQAAALDMRRAPIYFDDTSGLSIMQLKAKARRMHQQHGIKLLVVDYLQLIRGAAKKYDNRQTEVAEISSGLKQIAKELKIPVIVLAQLNREMEKENRRPRMSDLRESGAIEQDADVLGLLYKPKVKDEKDESPKDSAWFDSEPVSMLIAKQRNGQAMVEVDFTFLKSYTRFESAARVEAEDAPPKRTPHRQHNSD